MIWLALQSPREKYGGRKYLALSRGRKKIFLNFQAQCNFKNYASQSYKLVYRSILSKKKVISITQYCILSGIGVGAVELT